MRPPRHRCCLVWAATFEGMARVCPHCNRVAGKCNWAGSRDLLLHLVERSEQGHDLICRVPVRRAVG